MTNNFIILENVSKYYHTKTDEIYAIKNINLSIKKGEFISLVGPSGCGKSTILSLISGLFPPSSGTVFVDSQQVKKPSKKIGYMLQQDYLFNWRTIKENILLGLEIQKSISSESEERALSLLEEMDLTKYKDAHPNQLSGGMRQRTALVRTLATNPDTLLLDEPFSALDYQAKLNLEDLVVKTIRKHNKTAILVTHDISEAIAMTDRVIILGSNPGYIKKVINLPDSIKEVLPLEVRNIQEFQRYFHIIWGEMDNEEKTYQ